MNCLEPWRRANGGVSISYFGQFKKSALIERRKDFSRNSDIKEFVSANIDRFIEEKHTVGGIKDKSRSSKIKFIMEPNSTTKDSAKRCGQWKSSGACTLAKG